MYMHKDDWIITTITFIVLAFTYFIGHVNGTKSAVESYCQTTKKLVKEYKECKTNMRPWLR